MENGRSNAVPLLDEKSTENDTPIPSRMVIDDDTPVELQRITGTASLAEWADRHVGDTQIGKRKMLSMRRKGKGKKQKKTTKEKPVPSDDSTKSDNGSPTYQESDDSSFVPSPNDSDDPGATSVSPSTTVHFTGEEDFTHATQDQDHGAPHYQRTTMREGITTKGRQHHLEIHSCPYASESSISAGSSSPYPDGYDQYIASPPDTQPPPQWVYEWQDPDFYNLLLNEWQTTVA